EKIFILASNSSRKNFVKLSSRCQSGRVNLNLVLQKCVKGFEDASAGGHPKASAASFPKRYLEEFKRRLLENI
ncbi:hypothetical protein B6U91_00995, partial [Candidatus Pacearchaeota archaeon ex4484_71]